MIIGASFNKLNGISLENLDGIYPMRDFIFLESESSAVRHTRRYMDEYNYRSDSSGSKPDIKFAFEKIKDSFELSCDISDPVHEAIINSQKNRTRIWLYNIEKTFLSEKSGTPKSENEQSFGNESLNGYCDIIGDFLRDNSSNVSRETFNVNIGSVNTGSVNTGCMSCAGGFDCPYYKLTAACYSVLLTSEKNQYLPSGIIRTVYEGIFLYSGE